MKQIISLSFVFSAMPFIAFAATNITGVLVVISGILGLIMPILIAFAAVWFVWGVITYIMSKDEEQKKAGRSKIINGLIGLFVIIAFWGILGIVIKTFNVDKSIGDVVPSIPILDPNGNY